MQLIPRPYGHADVIALTGEVQAHYRALYGGEGDIAPTEIADFEPPTGHFVVGYVDGVPVAMGGWRRLGDRPGLPSPDTAEIKRMYVVPAARGQGLSRVVLTELENSARAAGIDWLVLETGRPQESAVGLYTSSGYATVDGTAFGHYTEHPDGLQLGKPLGRSETVPVADADTAPGGDRVDESVGDSVDATGLRPAGGRVPEHVTRLSDPTVHRRRGPSVAPAVRWPCCPGDFPVECALEPTCEPGGCCDQRDP